MTITNGNWRDILIRQKLDLSYGDTVVFNINRKCLTYKVMSDHLMCPNDVNNIIFLELKLDAYKFCEGAYGYRPERGGWPFFNNYSAATRAVIALFQLIEERGASKSNIKVITENSTQDISEIKEFDSSIKITIKPTQSFKIIL